MKTRNFLMAFSLLLILQSIKAQTIEYTPHNEIIANPERGFYHHTETHSGNYSKLSASTLEDYRTNESITQILRVFYLEKFRESPISTEYLNNVRADFAAARTAGIKCIIRFAYTTSSSSPYNDATPEVVQTHINQLKPVIRENADVIEVMQAGFIGAWGEWYYTDHFANSPGQISDQNQADRKQVITSLLDALPSDRMLQIRTPGYKMDLFEVLDPIDESNAFSNNYISRLGHHNDCFVASSSDYGTYINPEIEKPYLEQETIYTPMGGETCNLASPYSDCDNSLYELERFHWSYMNIDYNTQVLNEWKSQGCFNEVEIRLGYRYELISGEFTTSSKPEGTFSFNLDLHNVGLANPYNQKNLNIILRNQQTQQEYTYSINEDIRLWTLGEPQTISFEAGLPATITEGNYDLYLQITDPYQTLANRPAYSIQMANDAVWNSELGYNLLLSDININSASNTSTYMGSNYFLSASNSKTFSIPGSEEIFGGGGQNEITIYWGRQDSNLQRVIERNNGNGFEVIAAISGSQDYFTDANTDEETTYSYRYFLKNDTARTTSSNEITIAKSTTSTTIVTDGNSTDWQSIAPISTSIINGSTITLSGFFEAQRVSFLINGSVDNYSIYLNTDNNSTTGNNASETLTGMDYAIIDGALYEANTGEWTLTDTEVSGGTENSTEVSFDFNALTNLANNQSIPLLAVINNSALLNDDGTVPFLYRNLPPDLPTGFQVSKSESLPESRLLVSWNQCEQCTSYELMRSEDDINFELLQEVDASTTLIQDNNLSNNTTYYYKIASINEMGKSEYSESISESTGLILRATTDQPLLYPNPNKHTAYFDKSYKSVRLYNLSGHLVLEKTNTQNLDISKLSEGIYLIRLSDGKITNEVKVIKQ